MFKFATTLISTVLLFAFGGQAVTNLTSEISEQVGSLSTISVEGQINDGFDQAWAITGN